MKTWIALLCCCFVLVVPNFSQAADFSKALDIATTNIPSGADVAGMGNVQAAVSAFSSGNPAIVGCPEEPYRIGASATYAFINFKNGPGVNLYSGTVSAKMPVGYLQINGSNIRSGNSVTRMDTDTQFNSAPSVEVMYGLKVAENLLRTGDKLYLGAGGSFSGSKMSFSSQGQNLETSQSRGFGVKTGFLYQPIKHVSVGGFYSYSGSRTKTSELVQTENEDGSVSNGNHSRNSSGDVQQVRIGASWEILPGTLIAADFQHLNIGSLKRDQVFAGVEQQIIKDRLYVYGGWAASGPTAGIGVYLKHGGLNVAYMSNPFADLNPHLGRNQMIMATAYFNF